MLNKQELLQWKNKITHLVVTLHSQPAFTVMKVVLSIHSRNNRTEAVLYKSPEHITLQVILGIKVQQTEMELCINSHNRTEVALCINNLPHIPTEVALRIKTRIHYNLNGTLYQQPEQNRGITLYNSTANITTEVSLSIKSSKHIK